MVKPSNPIDRLVGSRVKMRRTSLGVTQVKLAEAVGVSFQQVQKYEKGTNRISASALQQIAKFLEVPAAYFFEGANSVEASFLSGFAEENDATYVADFLSTMEGQQLARAFSRIQDAKVRKRLVDLVLSLAPVEAVDLPASSDDSSS